MPFWLKANDTDLYNQINELNQGIINNKGGENHSAKFIELYTKAAGRTNGSSGLNGDSQAYLNSLKEK